MPEKIELFCYCGVVEASSTRADKLTGQLANNVQITSLPLAVTSSRYL